MEPTDEKRHFSMTLTAEQYEALKTMAAFDSLPMTAEVRQLVLAALRQKGYLKDVS